MAESVKARRLGWLWGFGATAALLSMAAAGVGWYVIHNVPSLMSDRRLIEKQSEIRSRRASSSLEPPLSWLFGKQSVTDEVNARIAAGRGEDYLTLALEFGVDDVVVLHLLKMPALRKVRIDDFHRIAELGLDYTSFVALSLIDQVDRTDGKRLGRALAEYLEIENQDVRITASDLLIAEIRDLERRNRVRAGIRDEYLSLLKLRATLVGMSTAPSSDWADWGGRAATVYERLFDIDAQRVADGAPEEH